MRMTNPQLTSPNILFDTRRGHVIDDTGIPYRLDDSGEKLRVRGEYWTPAETSVLLQLDELGNFKIEHPVQATTGVKFILPSRNKISAIGLIDPSDFKRFIGRNEEVDILVDKIQNIHNDDTKTVDNNRKLTVHGDEIRVIGASSDETVGRDKTISVGRNFNVRVGSSSNLNFTETDTSFEVDTLTILATKEIIFESPSITFNTPVANFTGVVRSEGGFRSNATNVAPGGSRGRAGVIPTKRAIRAGRE